MQPHAKLLKWSAILSVSALLWIFWSMIAQNLWGYDYPMFGGIGPAAIAGFFLGWLVFIPSAVTTAIVLLLRLRRRNSK